MANCVKKVTINTLLKDATTYSVTFQNSDFRTGGRLYLSHDLGEPQVAKTRYHPVGVDGNFVNYLGFAGQTLALIVQYVGNFETVEYGSQFDKNKWIQGPSEIIIEIDTGYKKTLFTYSRCTFERASLTEGPRAVVIPNKKYVRSIYGLAFMSEEQVAITTPSEEE
jgi:hypothetical protein